MDQKVFAAETKAMGVSSSLQYSMQNASMTLSQDFGKADDAMSKDAKEMETVANQFGGKTMKTLNTLQTVMSFVIPVVTVAATIAVPAAGAAVAMDSVIGATSAFGGAVDGGVTAFKDIAESQMQMKLGNAQADAGLLNSCVRLIGSTLKSVMGSQEEQAGASQTVAGNLAQTIKASKAAAIGRNGS